MQTLHGRTCVFAGASGGDGVASVHALCAAGMNVVMMTHQSEQAFYTCREIQQKHYPGTCSVVLDGNARTPPVRDEDVFREIYIQHGSLDVLICNIGGDGTEDCLDTVSREMLLREVDLLVGGSYNMLKCALPYLRESAAPRVIFMTTAEAMRGGTLESFTNAVARGAVWSLSKNCAARLAAEQITVNCIAKGAILRRATPGKGHIGKKLEAMLPGIPMGRLGTEEDLAAAICYLASEEASYVTGAVLDLSGGMNVR